MMDLAEHLAKNKIDIDRGSDTILVQIMIDGKWVDYCRTWWQGAVAGAVREFKLLDARNGKPEGTTRWQLVDWITREVITF